MIERIIDWSLRRRTFVILGALGLVAAGLVSLRRLDVDAFPDTTPVQVQINAIAPALGPEEVEQQITMPIEQAIAGLPSLTGVRSISKFGLSQTTATFNDATDVYFARQVVAERLASVALPPGIARPTLGPVATGLGEVFHYIVTSNSMDLTELHTAQDWIIKPALMTVPGVAEINTWGGYEKQYQVRIDPARLARHGVAFDEVLAAVESNNLSAGGGSVASNGAQLLVQGIGRVASCAQIGAIVIRSQNGVPIRVRDVADVEIGSEIRRGAVTYQGRGEGVLGLGFALAGANAHEVASGLRAKLNDLRSTLPAGLHVEPVYDRTELVDHVLDTVRSNLFEGGLLVIAVLFVFLGNLRAGLLVALAIPFSMLFAFSGMLRFGIAGSLMSLGAIDFGLVVDSSVIQIENVCRRVAANTSRGFLEIARDAIIEVRRPTVFGELIIMLVYVPILALEGVEGKLFRPMALTVIFALAGSLLLSLTLMPSLAGMLLSPRVALREPMLVRWVEAIYRPVLRGAILNRRAVLILSLAIMMATVIVARGLGAEFVPRLSEGAIAVNVIRLAGTDLSESIRYNTQMERALLRAFPDEIEHAWSRIGSADVATDPMGVELTDLFLSLQPRRLWKRARSQSQLADLVQRELRDLPGQRIVMTQPIEMRMNEMVSGVRADVAVKVYGDDLDLLARIGQEIAALLGSVSGAADVTSEQMTGQPVIQVRANQDALARHGISAKTVMEIVACIGSRSLGEVIEGQLRFPLVARLPERFRRDATAIAATLVSTSSGQRLPLSSLASIDQVERPSTITREWGQRRTTVQANVRGRDVGSFVAEAQQKLQTDFRLPRGRYRLEWSGQFEHLQRARTRLMFVVPATLLLIFVLLCASLGSLRLALLVLTGVPLAVSGGVAALWVREMPFSISAAVGFIALSGVAVLNGLVLVTFIRQLRRDEVPLQDAVAQAAVTRLRPVLMTGLVAALGFVPMALAQGMGAEVQRPLATVVVGGILSSTLLTLIVLPALYRWFEPRAGAA